MVRIRRRMSRNRKPTILRLIKRDGPGCWICMRAIAIQPTVDHVIPLSKGGSRGGMHNLKVACERCNCIKSDKLPAPEVVAAIRIKVSASVTNPTQTLSYDEQLQEYFKRARKRYVTQYEPTLTTEQRIALQKQDEK